MTPVAPWRPYANARLRYTQLSLSLTLDLRRQVGLGGRSPLLGLLVGQPAEQRRRHVLHVGTLTCVDRQLGQEDVVIDLVDQLAHLVQLALSAGVEDAVEAAGGCHLGQGMLRRERVRPASGLVDRVRAS